MTNLEIEQHIKRIYKQLKCKVSCGSAESFINLYTADGTLEEDRTVTQAGFDLVFTDVASNLSIINGGVTIPNLGATTVAGLQFDDGTDYFISYVNSTEASMLWIDQAGGIQSANVSVGATSSGIGMNVTATQRNQFFVNATSSELEIGDDTYGSTVSLALMSLQDLGAGAYRGFWAVRSSYTSDQDYDTTNIELNQSNIVFNILTPTVAGVDGTPLNKLTLHSTGLTITDYPNTRDDTGTFTPTSFLYTGAGGQLYEAPLSDAVPYLKWVGLLSQDGTPGNAPTAVVLENTLGGTIVWTYNAVGNYFGTLAGAFLVNKVFFTSNGGGSSIVNNMDRVSDNAVGTNIGDYTSGINVDGAQNMSIEIRVYP